MCPLAETEKKKIPSVVIQRKGKNPSGKTFVQFKFFTLLPFEAGVPTQPIVLLWV